MLPTVRFTPAELASAEPRPYTVAQAAVLLRAHGCLQIDGLFPTAEIERYRAAFLRRYRRFLRGEAGRIYPDALMVGPGRYMITVRVQPPFSTPALYANPLVLPIVRRLLGPECILGGFGAVAALPGAGQQHLHRDHPALFDDELDAALPPFALTLVVPFVEMNARNGTTRLYGGSHAAPDALAEAMPPTDPLVPAGSCLLMDYRLRHGGTPNLSPHVRPILYSIYIRPWFRDWRNYRKQLPVEIGRAQYQALEAEHRPLFDAATLVGRRWPW
jgi:hypothetical protein